MLPIKQGAAAQGAEKMEQKAVKANEMLEEMEDRGETIFDTEHEEMNQIVVSLQWPNHKIKEEIDKGFARGLSRIVYQ